MDTRRAGRRLPTDPKSSGGPATVNSASANDWVFTTTHWSMVIAASRRESQQADAALEKLCRGYWYPIYVFLRRSGWMTHDAEDLTQAFFERVLQKDYLRAVDRTKGKFRSFLLAMLRHFLANHRRDARTQKRGGHAQFVSLEEELDDEQHLRSAFADASAEQSFERQWAMTLLDKVVGQLHEEYQSTRKATLFDELKVFLTGEKRVGNYAELAVKLNTTEAALQMTVSRMRRRYGELLRAEIASTVSTPEEAEDELRALFAALS